MRILLVENDSETIALIERAVGRLPDCHVAAYADPSAAAEHLDKLAFDLALIGSHARGGGLSLLARLRRLGAHAQTPIVIMTGPQDRPETRIDAFEAGATDVM
ncbi:MAG TPA: response regulator, partial [Beijerinckiaceae bacterium]|nr:response regulator [Beijerinckiaceae bacterium]